MVPPQRGQSQLQLDSEAVGFGEGTNGQAFSKRRQSGNSSRRRRLARKPQKRIRTKPRGKV
jgi:hypothetical protein